MEASGKKRGNPPHNSVKKWWWEIIRVQNVLMNFLMCGWGDRS